MRAIKFKSFVNKIHNVTLNSSCLLLLYEKNATCGLFTVYGRSSVDHSKRLGPTRIRTVADVTVCFETCLDRYKTNYYVSTLVGALFIVICVNVSAGNGVYDLNAPNL